MYTAKTNWKPDDDIMETDVNRWEQGIADAHAQLTQVVADVSNLKTRMNTMESVLPENFVYNKFDDDLSTLDAIEVIRGYYNEAQSRLEV